VTTAVTVGVFAAMLLLGMVFYRNPDASPDRMKAVLALIPVILVSMLLARQFLQHQAVAPMQARLEARAVQQARLVAPFEETAFVGFREHLATVYSDGKTIYQNSCAFCHGDGGRGDGPEAGRLIVQPEMLTAVRARREYLYRQLTDGVTGSGMPYFTIFDKEKLNSLLDYMERSFGSLSGPPLPQETGDLAAARRSYETTCSTCHGEQGTVSDFGRSLEPPPPDFSQYSLVPERALEIITNGYQGTVMQPFEGLPEATRRGLAYYVLQFRQR